MDRQDFNYGHDEICSLRFFSIRATHQYKRVHMSFGKFWTVENAIFQDLEGFGRERIFENGYGNFFRFLFGEVLKIS